LFPGSHRDPQFFREILIVLPDKFRDNPDNLIQTHAATLQRIPVQLLVYAAPQPDSSLFLRGLY